MMISNVKMSHPGYILRAWSGIVIAWSVIAGLARQIIPLLWTTKIGLAVLSLTTFNALWVAFWWSYYRFGAFLSWVNRVFWATWELIKRWPELWKKIEDLVAAIREWLEIVLPKIGKWFYDILEQEWKWARDGNFYGLFMSLLVIIVSFLFTYFIYWFAHNYRGVLRGFKAQIFGEQPEIQRRNARGHSRNGSRS